MSSEHVNRILCAGRPSGCVEGIERLLEVAADEGAQAIAVVGDLGKGQEGPREVFHALGRARQPVYWVPGPGDAPAGRYLRESYNIEVACPQVRGVHGTAAFAPDAHVAFAGMGGAVNDDPDVLREDDTSLRYPRWEAAYRLKILTALDYNELVMLFATPPAHKGRNLPGSDAVAELIGTYRPRLVVTSGEAQITEIGRSLIVAPGSLADGSYAVAHPHARTAELGRIAVPSRWVLSVGPAAGTTGRVVPAGPSDVGMLARARELLHDCGTEGREVGRRAARGQLAVDDDLLVDDVGPGVAQIGSDAGPGRHPPSPHHIGLEEAI